MVEAATVTIIAHRLHHRVLTKHEKIVGRAIAPSPLGACPAPPDPVPAAAQAASHSLSDDA